MTADTTSPPKLLNQVRERLRLKRYSIRTEHQYVQWARRFILFHQKRHPAEMGAAEVEAFLTYLAVKEQVVAAAMQNQALSALLFCTGKCWASIFPIMSATAAPRSSAASAIATRIRQVCFKILDKYGLVQITQN
jgi:hypothetical protein